MKRALCLWVGLLALAGCEVGDAIANGDLDAWCGDVPCDWKPTGTIERVSTWHSHDYAASFESETASLEQANPDFRNVPCIEFSMVARVSRAEIAVVELDFLDDGIIDWDAEIPPGDFRQLTFAVRAPDWYEGVRFIVRKDGEGEVVLARLHARRGEGCTGDQVELHDLPGGSPCDEDANCLSESCISGYCTGCESDAECEGEEVCGYASVGPLDYAINVVPLCIAPETRRVGELCLGGSECESGVCCEGVCSECCGAQGCGDERTCGRALAGDGERDRVLEPFLCSSGESGDACASDDDCASGACRELECTGLCLPFEIDGLNVRCARLECEEASCPDYACGVETVEVGRCD